MGIITTETTLKNQVFLTSCIVSTPLTSYLHTLAFLRDTLGTPSIDKLLNTYMSIDVVDSDMGW